MMTREEQHDADLKALQDEIYRDKVLRARAMTPESRFSEALSLTDEVFERMHNGAMWQKNLHDPEEGWQEVERRLTRLRRMHEAGLYVDSKPQAV